MARDDGSAGAVFLAFIVGAVTGAAVALLWAPTTGEEARRFLGERAREGKDTVAEAIERGRQAYKQARSTATESSGQEEPA